MKFTPSKAPQFQSDGFSGWGYDTAQDYKNASIVYMEVTAEHFKMKNVGSDRIYCITGGVGSFTVDGETTEVTEKDVVIVPKNTPYSFKAAEGQTLKLLLIDTPAYNKNDDIKL